MSTNITKEVALEVLLDFFKKNKRTLDVDNQVKNIEFHEKLYEDFDILHENVWVIEVGFDRPKRAGEGVDIFKYVISDEKRELITWIVPNML